ncbi:hypothetical protein EDC01DRAFT_711752 [Geopyxis carbonaria]|nr:hypothetical protein EDC01DRAFT_711752 [Geopyxis carbonaria]
MLDFMDRVQNAFLDATGWNRDSSYATLNASARALLDFPTPLGLRLNLASLSSPQLATSYTLGSLGIVNGSISYLYSSLPLPLVSSTAALDLRTATLGYRQLRELAPPPTPESYEIWHGGRRIDERAALLYGRMYLPASTLEALYLRRLSPTRQLRLTAVSDSRLKPHGGTIMAMLQHDCGKYSHELLYSTDVALLGWRGLYNFGRDPRTTPTPPKLAADKPVGRFSAGAELYYGVLNKSAGLSTGVRYTTLPTHPGIPLTMTVTLNPLMGALSATYAVRAGEGAAFASRFEFNMYSYESDVVVGCELWRRKTEAGGGGGGEKRVTAEGTVDHDANGRAGSVGGEGVLKAKLNQKGELGVLWEGRVKELLFSVGGLVDVRRREGMVKALGVEVQYSS